MRSFQGPVHIQKPMAVPDVFCALSSGIHVGHAAQNRELGRRRILVQIDTGNVLGLELDRSEKVQSVKKKVQAALCVPTEQSALLFGDHVIEDDLSEVRNDTPLLLTRGLHRSSSTPCLSPTLEVSSPKDWSQPVELVGTSECCSTIKQLIQESIEALDAGVDPVLASGGLGGAYYFKNSSGQSIAIVKPTDEEPFAPNNPKGFVGKVLGEPGLKRAIRVGETGIREVAAYLLDYGHFARVPATSLVKVRHPVFNVNKESSVSFQGGDGSPVAKIASFQQFVKHDSDASDIGTSRFPVSAVHRIGILDVRIFNTDRHGGNILVRKADDSKQGGWMGNSFELIPIDHGLCLPEMLDDPYFEWLHWPQASMPFSEEELEYINKLDPYEDAEMLRRELPMLREGCLRMLILCTIFLKNAARSGLTLAEMGAMMSRELCGDNEELSELEKVCIQAKLQVDKAMEEEADESDLEVVEFDDDEDDDDDDDDLFAFPLETEEELADDVTTASASLTSSFVEAAADDHDDLGDTIVGELLKKNRSNGGFYVGGPPGGVLRPFGSPKYSSHKNRHDMNMKLRRFLSARNTCSFPHRYHSDATTGSGGVSDKLAGAENLVFSQMGDEVWERFLDVFSELLEEAFARRKAADNHLNFVQRLGTSCQF